MSDGAERPAGPGEILRLRSFALFWSATTVRALGSAIAGVAFQVLIVSVLNATPIEISLLSALGVAPYLFLGLIVGALMDRWQRQRTLIITSIGRAITLALIPVLLVTGTLTIWSFAAISLVLGVLTLFADSAAQPFLPQIVPRSSLVMANSRLAQSQTVAGTAGPALGGVLLTLIGAPILFICEAVITAVSAVLQSLITVQETTPQRRLGGRHIGHDIAEGMRYTYQHRTLRPLALSVHIWFLGNSIAVTVFAVFVLRELGLAPWAFGITVAFGGVGGFLGALLAPRIGAKLGAGRAILLGRTLAIVPWFALAVIPLTASSSLETLIVIISAAQFLYGLSMGIEDANDIAYRQGVAPEAMQGRMNSTIRTVNRVVFFCGALGAGLLATLVGFPWTLGVAAIAFAAAAAVVALSPRRDARHEDSADGEISAV